MCIGADIAGASPTQNLVRAVPENRRAAGERRGDLLRAREVNLKFPGWQTNILIRAIGLFREAYSKMMMVRLYGSGLTRDFMSFEHLSPQPERSQPVDAVIRCAERKRLTVLFLETSSAMATSDQ